MSKYGFYDEMSKEDLIREILWWKGHYSLSRAIQGFLDRAETRTSIIREELEEIKFNLSDINLEQLAKNEREKFNEVRKEQQIGELEKELHIKQTQGLMLDFRIDNRSVKSNWERFNNYKQTKEPYT